MALPYENTSSGKRALEDMQKILRTFGASSFGSYEDFAKGEVTVQFQWKERRVQISASAKGYAAAWLRHHPYSSRMKTSRHEYEGKAIQIGQIAVYSILRDWLKGQVTAVEVGLVTFEHAFLGSLLLSSGETVFDRVTGSDLLAIAAPRHPI